jgi:glycosyltransferase involved in cell wall biosynthesis
METVHCHILHRDPAVIVGFGGPLGPAKFMGKYLADLPAWFLVSPWWSIEDPGILGEILEAYPAYKKAYPGHEIVYLCNTDREVTLLRERGLPAVFCHQNAFIDERLFVPDPLAPKPFDAIYNARLSPFKRHDLARLIPRLALIYYGLGENERQMHALITRLLSEAAFLNGPPEPGRLRWFSPEKVAGYYNRSRVGLCLSDGEGAMYASAEYLLCGLPVVSIENIGGRDYFLDAPYCFTAEPHPEAVAQAVRYLGDQHFDPFAIRQAVLQKMLPERERLIALVQSILDASGKNTDFRRIWPEIFINKLHILNRDAAAMAESLRAGPDSAARPARPAAMAMASEFVS